MKDEIADKIDVASMRSQLLTIATTYPYLRVVCPWGCDSVLGADFPVHLEKHAVGQREAPSDWFAL